jgi:hypothetical protein
VGEQSSELRDLVIGFTGDPEWIPLVVDEMNAASCLPTAGVRVSAWLRG